MNYIIRIIQMVIFGCCILTTEDSAARAEVLEKEHVPGKSSRVQVVSVQNNTESLEFQVFPPIKEACGLSLPMATLALTDNKDKGVDLNRVYPLIIRCSKGSYRSVFIQDGDKASGTAPEGYSGPYCISMWLPYPHVADASKLRIPYVVKNGTMGKISIKIGPKGDYRLEAVSDIQFVHNPDIIA